jgi:hypothetical protein
MTVAAWANHVGEQVIMKLRRENSDSFRQPLLLQELSEKQLVERDETG